MEALCANALKWKIPKIQRKRNNRPKEDRNNPISV